MRFSLSPKDPRIHALVVAFDRDDVSIAAISRAVGEARTATRAAALEVLLAAGSSRVVDLPIALDALGRAKAREEIVLNQHKPP